MPGTVTPAQILQIIGCSMNEEVFTTDKRVYGEEICWNVTRLQRDATAGRFGAPIVRDFATYPKMSDKERLNIDWHKVAAMSKLADVMARPALAVCVDAGTEIHRLIVNGNHRICARQLRGLPFFEVHVVPVALEAQYRVRFVDGNGKPVHLGID